MLSDIILAFAIHSYLQITSKNDSHSTQILKKLFSEITENEKSFSLSENAQKIFQLDSAKGNKNSNSISSVLVKNRYNQLKNLSDIIDINLFSFQNQCFELFFDTNVEEFINFYKNAGRHSGLLSKFCISILQKISVMDSGEVGSIQNYLGRIFDFDENNCIENFDCENGMESDFSCSDFEVENDGEEDPIDDMFQEFDEGHNRSQIQNYNDAGNFTSGDQERYLKGQEKLMKTNEISKVDTDLVKICTDYCSINRRYYTLHLYHVKIEKSLELALKYLDDYFNTCVDPSKNNKKKNSNSAESEILSIRTRPYREYPLALAQMYMEFNNYILAYKSCLEAQKQTEGFFDEYNLQIYLSAEVLIKTMKRLCFKKFGPNYDFVAEIVEKSGKKSKFASGNSLPDRQKLAERKKTENMKSRPTTLNKLVPILSLKNYLMDLENQLEDCPPKITLKKMNLAFDFMSDHDNLDQDGLKLALEVRTRVYQKFIENCTELGDGLNGIYSNLIVSI